MPRATRSLALSTSPNDPNLDRPRERLVRQGAAALSDAELVALVFRTGARGRDAFDLARAALAAAGGIHPLASAPSEAYAGASSRAYGQIAAALGNRFRSKAST